MLRFMSDECSVEEECKVWEKHSIFNKNYCNMLQYSKVTLPYTTVVAVLNILDNILQLSPRTQQKQAILDVYPKIDQERQVVEKSIRSEALKKTDLYRSLAILNEINNLYGEISIRNCDEPIDQLGKVLTDFNTTDLKITFDSIRSPLINDDGNPVK